MEPIDSPSQVGANHARPLLDGHQSSSIAPASELLAALVNSSDDAIYVKTPQGVILTWNPAAEQLYGYAADEIIGKPARLLYPPDRLDEFEFITDSIKRGAAFKHHDTVRLRKDGLPVNISMTLSPVRAANGELLGASVISRDITERVKAEAALRASEAELSEFFENAAIAIHWVGPDGTILRVNRAELEMLGYTREEYVGHNIAEFHVDPEVIADILLRLSTGETLRDYDARMRAKDGSIKHVQINSSVLWENGRFIHTRCFTRDVTPQKRAERDFELAVEAAPNGFVLVNPEGEILMVNARIEQLFGYNRQELVGQSIEKLLPERFHNGHAFDRADYLAHPATRPMGNGRALFARRKDGSEFPAEIALNPIKTDRGTLVLGSIIDLSRRKAAEQALERQAALLDLAPAAIFVRDLKDRITYWNVGAERLYGWSAAEATGQVSHLLLQTRFSVSLEDQHTILREQGRWEGELEHVTRDGGAVTVLSRQVVERDTAGKPVAVLETNINITDRKQIEDMLRQREREFSTLVENAPDIIYRVDRKLRVIYINSTVERMANQPRSKYLGQPLSRVGMPPEEGPRFEQLCQDIFADGQERSMEFGALGIYYRTRVVPEYAPDGTIESLLGITEDTSEHKALERARDELFAREREAHAAAERNRARVQVLQDVTAALSRAVTRDEVAAVAVRQMMSAVQASQGTLMVRGASDDHLVFVYGSGYEPERLKRWFEEGTRPTNLVLPLAYTLQSGQPQWFESTDQMLARFPTQTHFAESPYQGAVAYIPLFGSDEESFGVVTIRFPEPRTIDEADRALMLALAQQAAQAMERAQLFEKESRARQAAEIAAQRSAALAEASQVLGTSLDYETTLKQVAEVMVRDLADWCVVHVLRPDGYLEQLSYAHRDPEQMKRAEEVQRRYPPRRSRVQDLQESVREGKPILIAEYTEDMLRAGAQDEEHLEILREFNITSAISAPMIAQGQLVGAISFISTNPQRHYNNEDAAFAELLANRSAVAVENARLYQATQLLNVELEQRVAERTTQLSNTNLQLQMQVMERERAETITNSLLRISSRLNATLDLDTVMDTLAQEAIALLNVQSGLAGLRVPEGIRITNFFRKGQKVPYDFTWKPGEGMVGRVLVSREPYMSNDLVADPYSHKELVVTYDTHSAVCTPILDAQGEVIAVFSMHDKMDGMPFNHADQELFTALSPLAAIAIQNARAYHKIRAAETGLSNSFTQIRALAARVESIREQERTHIARELHDVLGQALTALKYDLASISERLPKRDRQVRQRASAMSEQIDETIRTVRRLSSELRPGILDDLGLAAAIEWQASEFQNRTQVVCEVTVPEGDLSLSRAQATAVFRIFQETLTNVARHAQATQVQVSLEACGTALRLEVRDNGKGMDLTAPRAKSLGLLGMRERAELLGGTLGIASAPGQGTIITIELPLDEPTKPPPA